MTYFVIVLCYNKKNKNCCKQKIGDKMQENYIEVELNHKILKQLGYKIAKRKDKNNSNFERLFIYKEKLASIYNS